MRAEEPPYRFMGHASGFDVSLGHELGYGGGEVSEERERRRALRIADLGPDSADAGRRWSDLVAEGER